MVQKSNNGSNQRGQRKADERRRAILRAAAAAFRTRGIAATGMREIAEAADLSAANLYYYFASKDELLYFCQDYSLDRLLDTCRVMAASGLSYAERLRALIRAQLTCMLDELDGASAHLEVDALPLALKQKIIAKRDRYERSLRQTIADGIAAGAFAPCDSALVVRAILGALNWTARWYRPGGKKTAQDVADAFGDYLVRGLLPWTESPAASASTAKRATSHSPRTRRSSRSSART